MNTDMLIRIKEQCPVCKAVFVVQADRLTPSNLSRCDAFKVDFLDHMLDCAINQAGRILNVIKRINP